MNDVEMVTFGRRRTYLIQSPVGFLWVMLTRQGLSEIRTAVFVVRPTNRTRSFPTPRPTNVAYRVSWVDSLFKTKKDRSRTQLTAWSSSLKDAVRDERVTKPYMVVRPKTGSVEFTWFHVNE